VFGPGAHPFAGERIVLIDRENRADHMPWILIAVLTTVAASVWFFVAAIGSPEWPGGSSLPGFTFGVLGGVIILFELLLWWRKKVRRWHIGRTKVWMSAHIWLGLLCVPLLAYHSGFCLGGTLSTLLMLLFLLVIASGVWGLVLQQVLPQRMLMELPAETIYSQIDHVASQLAAEAEQLVLATCGPVEGGLAAREKENEKVAELTAAGHLTVGLVRSAGRVQGKVLQSRVPRALTGEAEALRCFFQKTIAPFLTQGSRSGSPLQHPTRAAAMFLDVKSSVDPTAYEMLDTLESLCEQRRQLDRQTRMHFWLHSWLAVHLPLSIALTALMVVHAWVALKYW
jgi:hypothetical protein